MARAITELKDWKPWNQPLYAESRLTIWGNPLEPPEKWNKDKYQRLKRLPKLLKGKSVLDVGCGLGHSYVIIKPFVEKYLGLDLEEMIRICHKFFPKELFEVGDIFDLSALETYDTVLAIQIFIHLPELHKPLNELWEHTGQRLVFTVRPPTSISKFSQKKNTGLISHNFSREELAREINKLKDVSAVKVYRSAFTQGCILYVVIDKRAGCKTKIKPDIFLTTKMQII